MKVNSDHITESEVQSDLRYCLMNLGYNVYLERYFKIGDGSDFYKKKKLKRIRVDVAVCDKYDNLICVVEVKNIKEGREKPKEPNSRQTLKYQLLKVPYIYCWNRTFFNEVIDFVKTNSK
jgi:hypothetical protein